MAIEYARDENQNIVGTYDTELGILASFVPFADGTTPSSNPSNDRQGADAVNSQPLVVSVRPVWTGKGGGEDYWVIKDNEGNTYYKNGRMDSPPVNVGDVYSGGNSLKNVNMSVAEIENKVYETYGVPLNHDMFMSIKGKGEGYAKKIFGYINEGILRVNSDNELYADTSKLTEKGEDGKYKYIEVKNGKLVDTEYIKGLKDSGLLDDSEWFQEKYNFVEDSTDGTSSSGQPAEPETIPELDNLVKTIEDRIANPAEINPDSVTKWTDFINKTQKTQDETDITKINEQFSALGDLGSSANRQAISAMVEGKTNERALQALNIAFGERNAQNQAVETGISQLTPLLGQKQQLKLLPWQQKWAEYLQKQSQSYDLMKTSYTLNKQEDIAKKNYEDMLKLYESTKPAESSPWDALIGAGLTAVGTAIGGPVGGAIGAGLSGLLSPTKKEQQPAIAGTTNNGITVTRGYSTN